jgi:hypothetical protein
MRCGKGLEHFPAKWIRSAVENASGNKEPFPAKWLRFVVEKASDNKTRADSV